jgi:hypothetical protein
MKKENSWLTADTRVLGHPVQCVRKVRNKFDKIVLISKKNPRTGQLSFLKSEYCSVLYLC